MDAEFEKKLALKVPRTAPAALAKPSSTDAEKWGLKVALWELNGPRR